jgi:undecaprenyl diphosphate synthase
MDTDSPSQVPRHLGIIMDGNGRWATRKGVSRSEGHKEGLKVAKAITQAASDLGISYLSLYVFSTENWKRAEQEVSFLMFLLKTHLLKEWDFYRENRIRVVHSGDLSGLPAEIQSDLKKVVHDTADFRGLTVNLAINYGGQDEIVRAANRWRADSRATELSVEVLSSYLDQPEIPPVDLVIRTGGELRISNFLLWESAYAEFYFSDKLWPDWSSVDLHLALAAYHQRVRRFGGRSRAESE